MKQKVVVAMSGGVDSSAAAALLVEKNYDVIGIGLRLADHHNMESSHRGCCAPRDLADARSVASILKFSNLFFIVPVLSSAAKIPFPEDIILRAMEFRSDILIKSFYTR